jgi:hypothetical protein
MKRTRALLTLSLLSLCVLQLAANRLPPGFTPAVSGTRHEIAGCVIEVPGKGWVENKTDQAVVFGKRIDATESYHAGMSIRIVPAHTSKADFNALGQQLATAESGNPRYRTMRKEFKEDEADGFWMLRGRVDFEDSGAVNVRAHGALATHGAHIFLLDPRQPERLITLWFSRRAAEFDDVKFTAEAQRFFASFKRARN